jgi:hypothetical protein
MIPTAEKAVYIFIHSRVTFSKPHQQLCVKRRFISIALLTEKPVYSKHGMGF